MTDLAAAPGLRLQIAPPVGWHRMPDPGAPASRWVSDLVLDTGYSGSAGEKLAASLRGALATAAAQNAPKRLRFVYLGDPPRSALQAWAFVDLVPRTRREEPAESAAERYAAAFAEPVSAASAAEVWHREVSRIPVGLGPAVLVHDLLTLRVTVPDPTAGPERRLQHRVIVAVFPKDEPLLLRLTLSTPRLGAFPDIEQAARELVESVQLGTDLPVPPVAREASEDPSTAEAAETEPNGETRA